MIYVVGTGRCGTGSYAVQFDGLHEPEPSIGRYAMDYRESGFPQEAIIPILKKRSEMKTNCISDNKQSLVIDLIRDIDSKARFVWLIRDPISCVVSFLRRGKWGCVRRWKPDVKGFHGFRDEEKLAHYWIEKNRLIEDQLKGVDFDVIETKTLLVTSNRGNSHPVRVDPEKPYFVEALEAWKVWKERYFDTSSAPV